MSIHEVIKRIQSPYPEHVPRNTVEVEFSIGDEGLLIGENSTPYKYASRKNKGRRDYTFERIRALEVLVETQGQVLESRDFWAAIYQDDREYDPLIMNRVDSWLERIAEHEGDEFIFKIDKTLRGNPRYFVWPSYKLSIAETGSAEQEAAKLEIAQNLGELALSTK